MNKEFFKKDGTKINVPDDYYKGYVTQILNNYRLVINLGSDEIKVNDIIAVVEPGTEIIDPDNGSVLGIYSFEKAELVVTATFPKYSICFSNESTTMGISNIASTILTKKTILQLDVNESESEDLERQSSIISIGDPIIVKK